MPRISEDVRKHAFLDGVAKRLQNLYVYGEAHPDEKPVIEANLDGYFEAGLLVKLVTRAELQKVIDAQHLKVFGMSREERKKKRQALEGSQEGASDWSVYDLPPAMRNS